MAELVSFFIVMAAGLFLAEFFRPFHMPYVVVLILAGIFIGPFGLNFFQPDETIEFIEKQSKGIKPWMFFASWIPPHGPYASPPEFRKHYEGRIELPPNVPEGLPEEFARRYQKALVMVKVSHPVKSFLRRWI